MDNKNNDFKKLELPSIQVRNLPNLPLLLNDQQNKRKNRELSREIIAKMLEEGEKDFRYYNMSNLNLQDLNFQGTFCRSVNFTGSNLENTEFTDADLQFSKCNEANFTNANLDSAHLSKADFTGANLTNVTIDYASCVNTNFTNATCINAAFTSANLNNADFTRTNFSESTFANSTLDDVIFDHTDLTNADLSSMDSNILPDDDQTSYLYLRSKHVVINNTILPNGGRCDQNGNIISQNDEEENELNDDSADNSVDDNVIEQDDKNTKELKNYLDSLKHKRKRGDSEDSRGGIK